MGIFRQLKDMRDAVNAAPGLMADAQQMAARAATLAASAAGGAAGAGGFAERWPAVITGLRQVGTVNFDLLVEFELTVTPQGRPPYPATTEQLVSQFQVSRLRPGLTLSATVDPANPAAIWLDFGSL